MQRIKVAERWKTAPKGRDLEDGRRKHKKDKEIVSDEYKRS
jgi:hypothetical protein